LADNHVYGDHASAVVLNRIFERFPQSLSDIELDRLFPLLEKLGNPHLNLPPVIHVAGTNGKGSTIAFMRAILEAAGKRVHVSVSPHLVDFRERIRLGGSLISEEALITLLEECETAAEGLDTTFFEITTAAMFLAFSREPADICLIEVGLGGRLDATNVIREPAASVITHVHLDHMEVLGPTFKHIAVEKAGIIKPKCTVITGDQLATVFGVIQDTAKNLKAPLKAKGKDWTITLKRSKKGGFKYQDCFGTLDFPNPYLKGTHQIKNAALAVATLRHLKGIKVNKGAYKAGLDWVRWPGRMQNISDSSLAKVLPKDSQVWLDGGHNPFAGRMLANQFKGLDTAETPFYLVVGMMKQKDVVGFLRPFRALAQTVVAVTIPNQPASLSSAMLAAEASSAGIQGRMAKDVKAALKMIGKETTPKHPPVILVAGSLYLAGSVLKEIKFKLE
jgi:dihydrofolate synthase/folylpolyglutamate synthase